MSFMAEPKPIASLSSGLLARKGAARPAMRRQGLGGLMPQALPQEDLGWDDMGYDVDPPHDAPLHDEGVPHYGNMLAGAIPDAIPAAAPPVPEVVRQQADIAERLADAEATDAEMPASEPSPTVIEKASALAAAMAEQVRAAPASGRRAAFTLRLDSERHLRLRLASAVTGQSAQQLVTAALDDLLTKIPEIDDLAGRVPRPAGR